MGCQEAERKARLLEHPSPGRTPGRRRKVWMGSDNLHRVSAAAHYGRPTPNHRAYAQLHRRVVDRPKLWSQPNLTNM